MKTKICTSLEQSKKLLELGIDVNTADMFWDTLLAKKPEAQVNNHHFIDEYDDEHRVPAWSLVAMLKLMPFHIIENNNRYAFHQGKGFNKKGETYRFSYKTNYDSFLFETSLLNDVVDAAFEMVVWLKENGKI